MFNLRKRTSSVPTIVIVAGFAGSGKSTIGKLISKNLHNLTVTILLLGLPGERIF